MPYYKIFSCRCFWAKSFIILIILWMVFMWFSKILQLFSLSPQVYAPVSFSWGGLPWLYYLKLQLTPHEHSICPLPALFFSTEIQGSRTTQEYATWVCYRNQAWHIRREAGEIKVCQGNREIKVLWNTSRWSRTAREGLWRSHWKVLLCRSARGCRRSAEQTVSKKSWRQIRVRAERGRILWFLCVCLPWHLTMMFFRQYGCFFTSSFPILSKFHFWLTLTGSYTGMEWGEMW